ncbi:MAG: DNA-directed RNA polymerase subunit alpha [Clostridiales bacterium]|nr:DNA-directed RNA polymerase subunit alpha [Clostridiales bacterium]
MSVLNIERPKVEITEINESKTYGQFVVEPLERGFGTTIGNALRRVLLSSIPGVAASYIKIDGVLHEFSTVPGVKEDVTDIVLNIKNLALKIVGAETSKTIYIDAEGEGEVCARDIKADADVEIINPDMHIATLNKDARLYIEIGVNQGRGYVAADKNKEELQPEIGIIPIDSIYSPIRKVNYYTEDTRVGQVTDYDKLVLQVWTDGTIAPDEALSIAAGILHQHIELFTSLVEMPLPITPEIAPIDQDNPDKEILEMVIEEMDLSVRSYNCLKRAGINTVGDLTTKTEDDMMKVRNLGRKSLEEVIYKLHQMGLDLQPIE